MASLYRVGHKLFPLHDPGGAVRTPGRWHSLGQPVLYFSSSLPLAIFEQRANGISFHQLRAEYRFVRVDIDLPRAICEVVPPDFFKSDWMAAKRRTRDFGSAWVTESRSLVLSVKSAVLPTEANYMVNTGHDGFKKLGFSDPAEIPLDSRL
jgi:RES domain-containing protein